MDGWMEEEMWGFDGDADGVGGAGLEGWWI